MGESTVWIVAQGGVNQRLCILDAIIVDKHISTDGIGIGCWNGANLKGGLVHSEHLVSLEHRELALRDIAKQGVL